MTMITSPNVIATPTWPSAPVLSTMIAAAGEDERERPDRLRDEGPCEAADSIARRQELPDQRLHASVELVADPTYRFDVLTGRVVERPVLVPRRGRSGRRRHSPS